MTTTDDLSLYALEGHDRDAALAMLSQSRLPHASRIDDIQVRDLLAIGYRAGRHVSEADATFDRTDCRFALREALLFGAAGGALVCLLAVWVFG